MFRKSVREQKRDLMVLGLSLAFAPLFVVLYWLMTGGSGSTTYGVLVINNDVSVPRRMAPRWPPEKTSSRLCAA